MALVPRPLDPGALDHVPRPDQGSDRRKAGRWLGEMSVVQSGVRGRERLFQAVERTVCGGEMRKALQDVQRGPYRGAGGCSG